MMNIDLTNIGIIQRDIFRDCTSLKSVLVNDNSSTKVNSKDTIKNSIKQQCDKGLLKNIVLSNNLTAIESNAFSGCKSLELVQIPTNVIRIGTEVFMNCKNLKTVVFKDNTTGASMGKIVGEAMFLNCTSLKTVLLSNDLEKIEEQAFLDCTALKQIEIPKNVKEIKDRAFCGCESLKTVVITAKEPPLLDEEVFPIEEITFKVPKGSIEKYKNKNCWIQYKEMIQEA